MNAVKTIGLLMALAFAPLASAVIETYEFSDPLLEQRYQALSEELRCPKCQNQNIADSNAPIAKDLRKMLHKQLEEGASDTEIRDFMVARYGEFVRYRPSFSGANRLLWLAPLVLLGIGLVVLIQTIRSKRRAGVDSGQALNEEERARLEALLSKRSKEH